jgi:hypothetical protein
LPERIAVHRDTGIPRNIFQVLPDHLPGDRTARVCDADRRRAPGHAEPAAAAPVAALIDIARRTGFPVPRSRRRWLDILRATFQWFELEPFSGNFTSPHLGGAGHQNDLLLVGCHARYLLSLGTRQ